MPFYPPAWVDPLPFQPPDDVSLEQFMLTEKYGRTAFAKSRNPFVCGLTGKSYSTLQVIERVDALARGLSKELGFLVNDGTEYDKVIAVFSINTIDNMTLAWATHRLGGIQSPANASYSQSELEYQLKDSGATCLFTCLPLLQTAKGACKNVGIPENRIFLLECPDALCAGMSKGNHKTVDDFVREGQSLKPLPAHKWRKGEGAKRTAFLCYSSGTSGLPKGVMLSHRNVITNILQMAVFNDPHRKTKIPPGKDCYTSNILALLPMSHIYALVVVCHVGPYRGDSAIVLPKFEMNSYLKCLQTHKVSSLYVVPPIVILMAKSKELLKKHDLSAVETIFTGAAPLGAEVAEDLQASYPNWIIRQGYGLTETTAVVASTSADDIWFGSAGSLLPGFKCKLIDPDGKEVTGYDTPGELWVKSTGVALGYLNNAKATRETFVDGYMRTGDEAVFRRHPESGNEHLFITDRIKELIKVKGLQVAPAELEAHLLSHPMVADCVVIGVPNDDAGEVPKAFVVKSQTGGRGIEESDAALRRDIAKHVEKHKARHKWIKGGIEFVDEVPKSPSGKILRRMVRDKDRAARKAKGAKL